MALQTTLDSNELKKYAESQKSRYESLLKELVDIPSVSMDPEQKGSIKKLAERAAKLLSDAGAKSEVIQTKGNPVVIGEFVSSPNNPTVTIYNHLDVQPADPNEWQNPPFDMKIENDRYLGRGTTDDKGPALAVFMAACYAHQNKIPINIKFIWELEEEIGSPNFEDFLVKNKSKLNTDSVCVSDTIWIARDKPAICAGLRGLQGFLVKLKTGEKDVHSGTTGGLARNPIAELAQLISECFDAKTGEVKIPGFYDDYLAPSDKEKQDFVDSGFNLDAFQKAHELKSLRTRDTKDATTRIWAKPTFEVHGITGGYSGPGVKTIVPHYAEAKISMRLVPNQTPERIIEVFTKFVKEKCPDATVELEGSLKPYAGPSTDKFQQAAKQAMHQAFGKEPAFVREGGSIGAVVSMQEVLGIPITFLGLSLPEHGYHAVNENFDWTQAAFGIRLFIQYFELLSQIK